MENLEKTEVEMTDEEKPDEGKKDFEGRNPIPGYEHLGAAITDLHGHPSGSPANYESLRGQTGEEPVEPPSPEHFAMAIDSMITLPIPPEQAASAGPDEETE